MLPWLLVIYIRKKQPIFSYPRNGKFAKIGFFSYPKGTFSNPQKQFHTPKKNSCLKNFIPFWV
jgi:hypothetical protein